MSGWTLTAETSWQWAGAPKEAFNTTTKYLSSTISSQNAFAIRKRLFIRVNIFVETHQPSEAPAWKRLSDQGRISGSKSMLSPVHQQSHRTKISHPIPSAVPCGTSHCLQSLGVQLLVTIQSSHYPNQTYPFLIFQGFNPHQKITSNPIWKWKRNSSSWIRFSLSCIRFFGQDLSFLQRASVSCHSSFMSLKFHWHQWNSRWRCELWVNL